MLKNYYPYLRDIGLSEIQIQLYEYILNNNSGTINEIKEELNYSYAQTDYNLSVLEEMGLVFSSNSGKSKRYFRIDPKIALTKILDNKLKNYQKQIEEIVENIKIEESTCGICIKDIDFYHYTDFNLAIENFFTLFENSEKEIYLTSLPPSLLKKLEPALYKAFMRGIKVILYFSLEDFQSLNNYFDTITNILKRIRAEIIQIKEKTCQNMRYNDVIVNNGLILIDEKYFNSILFIEDDTIHFNGFYSPDTAKQLKKYLEIKTVVKKIDIKQPDPVQYVLDLIHENKSISTRDLSKKSKIGGTKIKEILTILTNQGLINETVVKGDAGKPRHEYSSIN